MSKILFSEIQKFRQTWLYLLIGFSNLVVIIPLGYGFFIQIIKGEPWGQTPMSDNGLLALILISIGAMMAVNYLVFASRLEVEIKDNTIYYKYFPLVWNWKSLYKDYIDQYEIRSISPLSELGGYGYRRRFFKKKTGFVMSGNKAMVLKLTDGKTLIIGTQRPEELKTAMNSIMKEEIRY